MIWREKFLRVDITPKISKNIIYRNFKSAIRPLLHGPDVPITENPAVLGESTTSFSEPKFGEDNLVSKQPVSSIRT